MEIDVIEISQEEYQSLSAGRKELVRAAQKRKNELRRRTQRELSEYKNAVYAADMKESSLIEQMRVKLEADFAYETEIIAEQLRYDLAADGSGGQGGESPGYVVDYSLPYIDRYSLVRSYYLSIADSAERMERYKADDVAKRYLGSYYQTLYDVLSTYED